MRDDCGHKKLYIHSNIVKFNELFRLLPIYCENIEVFLAKIHILFHVKRNLSTN